MASTSDSGSPPAESASTGGGCPVKHSGGDASSGGGGWSSWFGLGGNRSTTASNSSSALPPQAPLAATTRAGAGGGCPVKHDAGAAGGGPIPFASAAAIPASIEEAASHPQMPRPDQRIPLSTRRVMSTIPRADELRDPLENRPADANASASDNTGKKESTCAPHQSPEHTKWVYPSEQQFYNALRRKGWRPEESTIPDVVRIHNAVNERGWSEVQKWETLRGNDTPRLVRFMGRPKDLSPRAWFNSRILWYHEPFDRHDWYVDGGEDTTAAAGDDASGGDNAKPKQEPRRYVIDFYSGDDGGFASSSSARSGANDANDGAATPPGPRPPSMYIDVRPALDDPDSAIDRMKMFVQDAFPGLSTAFGIDGDSNTTGGSGGNDNRK